MFIGLTIIKYVFKYNISNYLYIKNYIILVQHHFAALCIINMTRNDFRNLWTEVLGYLSFRENKPC